MVMSMKKHLNILDKYSNNITIDPTKSDDERFNSTVDAIKKGYDLIYKAYFIEGKFRGEADFIIKTKQKSNLGDYSYEVYDTKITKNLKPKHVLQVTAYSYLISKITGVLPKQMYLIDGNSKYHPNKVSEFLDYFKFTKSKFESFLSDTKTKAFILKHAIIVIIVFGKMNTLRYGKQITISIKLPELINLKLIN